MHHIAAVASGPEVASDLASGLASDLASSLASGLAFSPEEASDLMAHRTIVAEVASSLEEHHIVVVASVLAVVRHIAAVLAYRSPKGLSAAAGVAAGPSSTATAASWPFATITDTWRLVAFTIAGTTSATAVGTWQLVASGPLRHRHRPWRNLVTCRSPSTQSSCSPG